MLRHEIPVGTICGSMLKIGEKSCIRPVLVIGREDVQGSCDYTCLPVSRVTSSNRIDPNYDVKITTVNHPRLNMQYEEQYIRSHKVMTLNSCSMYCNKPVHLDLEYPDTYSDVISCYSNFAKTLFKNTI